VIPTLQYGLLRKRKKLTYRLTISTRKLPPKPRQICASSSHINSTLLRERYFHNPINYVRRSAEWLRRGQLPEMRSGHDADARRARQPTKLATPTIQVGQVQMNSPMQDYYAARAPEYDKVYLKPERQADLRMIERWLPSVFEGANVLEVACGTGYWTQFMAPVASHVLAIDAAPETIAIAQNRVSKEKVTFLVGDAYALPQHEPGPDAAFAGFWFSHVPKARAREFLLGLQAALMPGARVVLLDNLFVAGSSSAISETDSDGNTYQARHLSDGTTHRVLKNFPSEAELRTLMDGIGTRVSYKTWQYFWALEYETVLQPL
jgi:ubiquinone/menaquinone biosynthesis C-methylase UbiE